MRYAIAASAICGLVAAAPQMINIEAALAVPTPTILGPKVEETKAAPVSYNPTAAASAVAAIVKNEGAVEKRDAALSSCGAQQPGGFAPLPSSGSKDSDYTAEGSSLRALANAATPPSGYTESFKNKLGSSQQIGYLTYKNIDSQEYNVQACADFCDSEKFCLGFNIFYERDPKFEPKEGCANPEAQTNLKCSLYGYPVAEATATNEGQWRGPQDTDGQAFHVVITGSNGYSKTGKGAPTVPDFNAPKDLPAAINAPLYQGKDTYNGMRLFNDNPYDPSLCAAACEAQTTYDKGHPAADGTYKPCNFFTSYILTKNGVPLGTYCSLYTRSWGQEYAVNTGYYYGSDKYSVVNAASYEFPTFDNGNGGVPQ
ncbi:hypothetical protein EKO04_007806 [Ascochyta lentis]|uniref:Uncharacterized protein n=1 Tax=Ascochyta lentis TaxID=205686 RepID=A0A8H7J007_9PLEO|nr:hypothetical protein EKO04_007806 [Ascochyta lentis]